MESGRKGSLKGKEDELKVKSVCSFFLLFSLLLRLKINLRGKQETVKKQETSKGDVQKYACTLHQP